MEADQLGLGRGTDCDNWDCGVGIGIVFRFVRLSVRLKQS